jgi:FkbM family methyltransferase
MNMKIAIGWWISKVLYEGNPWKKKRAREFYSQFIKEGDLCFDVGAHLGDRSAVWLSLGAMVVGVEPQPRFSSYLASVFKGNQKYYNEEIALGATKATSTLHISNLFPTLSTLSGKEWRNKINRATPLTIPYDETIEINVLTLDDLISKYGRPVFIKIDVEGYESEVLKGLSQPVDYISFEVLSFNADLMEECLLILSKLGYAQFNFSLRETFKMAFNSWVEADYMKNHLNKNLKLYTGDIYARIHHV